MTIFNRLSLKGLLLGATIFASPLLAAIANAGGRAGVGRDLGPDRTAGAAGLCAAADAAVRLYLDPRLLGLGQRAATTGCPAPGCSRRGSACCGRRPTGAGSTAAMCFNAGYWGPHVGFYGGVNYGFGYGGVGYEGGRWNNGRFAYNRTVNNFGSIHVTNVYEQNVTVINNTNVSYNGGTGGVRAAADRRGSRGRERAAYSADRRADRSTSPRPPGIRRSRRATTAAIRRSPPPRVPPNSRGRAWCALPAPPNVRPKPERRTRRRSIPSPRTRPRRTQRPHYVPLRSVSAPGAGSTSGRNECGAPASDRCTRPACGCAAGAGSACGARPACGCTAGAGSACGTRPACGCAAGTGSACGCAAGARAAGQGGEEAGNLTG